MRIKFNQFLMSKVNIPASNTDPFFRYTREKIKIRILNNNGGVTKIENLESIAKDLNVEIKTLLSWFKKKLNAAIIDKDHTIKKVETVINLESLIEDYIKLYVLCPKCFNPEFNEIVEKKSTTRACKACGNVRPVEKF